MKEVVVKKQNRERPRMSYTTQIQARSVGIIGGRCWCMHVSIHIIKTK